MLRKNYISVLMLTSLAFLATACGNNNSSDSDKDDDGKAEKKALVGKTTSTISDEDVDALADKFMTTKFTEKDYTEAIDKFVKFNEEMMSALYELAENSNTESEFNSKSQLLQLKNNDKFQKLSLIVAYAGEAELGKDNYAKMQVAQDSLNNKSRRLQDKLMAKFAPQPANAPTVPAVENAAAAAPADTAK